MKKIYLLLLLPLFLASCGNNVSMEGKKEVKTQQNNETSVNNNVSPEEEDALKLVNDLLDEK